MIPLDASKTVRYRSLRTGRSEVWEATSADGLWSFLREESPGTPWVVVHRDHGPVGLAASLPKARKQAPGMLATVVAWGLVALAEGWR